MSTDVKSMHMGQITSFFIPNVTLVGEGCSKEIPARLKSIGGTKPLIVTDQGIVKAGILKQITDILDNAKMPYAVSTRPCRIRRIKTWMRPLKCIKRKSATA